MKIVKMKKPTIPMFSLVAIILAAMTFASCDWGIMKEEDAPESRLQALTTFSHWEISSIDGHAVAPESDEYKCYQFQTDGTLDIYNASKIGNTWYIVIDSAALGSKWTLGHDTLTMITNGKKTRYYFTTYRKKRLVFRNMAIRNTIGLIPSAKNLKNGASYDDEEEEEEEE